MGSFPNKAGRRFGARNKLTAQFLEALAADFEEGGAAAMKVARLEDPLRYIAIVASLMPKELAVEHSQLGDLSNEELNALLEYVQIERAKLIEHKPQTTLPAIKKRPKALPDIKVVGVLEETVDNDRRDQRR
jgi:hypothetical protein